MTREFCDICGRPKMTIGRDMDLCCYCMSDLQTFLRNPDTVIVKENNNA